MSFLLSGVQGAVQSELDQFFAHLRNRANSVREVTAQVFYQARYRINALVFGELTQGKRSAHSPLGAHNYTGFLRGNSSSMRLFGQAGSFAKVSVSQAMGSIPFARAVSSSD